MHAFIAHRNATSGVDKVKEQEAPLYIGNDI